MTESSAPRRNASGLRRDLDLLEALTSSEARNGLGVTRLAELTGRDKGQVSRTLATLDEAGFVERDAETLVYTLGSRIFSLAAQTAEARLVKMSAPYLRRVVAATHETTHLCALRGGSVLTLASEISEHAFRGLGWEGVRTSAWRTSSGRALMSDWNDEELGRWYHAHIADEVERTGHLASATDFAAEPVDQATSVPLMQAPPPPPEKLRVTDLRSFLTEIHLVQQQGFATVDEEFEAGVVGVSAPVTDFRGKVVAAINISAPKSRLGTNLQRAGAYAAHVAAELSRALGAGDPATK